MRSRRRSLYPLANGPFTIVKQTILSLGVKVSRHTSAVLPHAMKPLALKIPDPARLRIVNYPDPVLSKRAVEVTEFNETISTLAARMLELMREAKGIGLAAPQVGIGLRLFVCNATGQPGDDLICVNPTFLDLSGAEENEEGCLSIPNVNVRMRRPCKVLMSTCNLRGERIELNAADLLARIWQHETDHLDGKLIIDNMSATDEIANRKALQQLRDAYKRRKGKRT